jgi:N-acetylglucosamine-6-sulfatase
LILLFPFLILLMASQRVIGQPCQLPAPTQLETSEVTSCSALLTWKKVSGIKKYRVKYQKIGDTGWSGATTITGTSYTFTGLLSNTKYSLSVQAVCQSGGYGDQATIKVKTGKCTLPFSVTSESVSPSEQMITVGVSCPFDTVYCQYGTEITSLSNLSSSTGESVTISNLQPGTKYYFRVSTCPLNNDEFTPIDSFITPASKPNIILIVLDDARYDHYSCNGAPDFMQTPNIDRLANEGVNFKNSFVVHSECGPSRASIVTGVYTVRHKVFDNAHPYLLDESLPLLPEILHNNGYYTAMVGKTHDLYFYEDGLFDYWMVYEGTEGSNKHTFNLNGVDSVMKGYDTDIMSDSMVNVIGRAAEPYFIHLGYRAPHDPLKPAAEYDTVFSDETIPAGVDTAKYTKNYPSFLYQLGGGALADWHEAKKTIRETLEMILSIDDGVGAMLQALEDKGELENTMIIFTSDNGHLIGEHNLDAKRFAYEQSIRVPLFIRYPQWFEAGSVDTANLALNIDFMPTILEAAGLSPDDFALDGVSLKGLYDGTDHRTSMYYHYWYSPENSWVNLPPIRAVRDLEHVLIDYGCQSDTVQEFFDLTNDPLQLTNQINNSAYSSTIDQYRAMLTTMAEQLGDTLADNELTCSLANPVYTRETVVLASLNLAVYPNPSDGLFTIENFGEKNLRIIITNELGVPVDELLVSGRSQQLIRVPSQGIYLIHVTEPGLGNTGTVKLIVQ